MLCAIKAWQIITGIFLEEIIIVFFLTIFLPSLIATCRLQKPNKFLRNKDKQLQLHKKWSFPLRNSFVMVKESISQILKVESCKWKNFKCLILFIYITSVTWLNKLHWPILRTFSLSILYENISKLTVF